MLLICHLFYTLLAETWSPSQTSSNVQSSSFRKVISEIKDLYTTKCDRGQDNVASALRDCMSMQKSVSRVNSEARQLRRQSRWSQEDIWL